jgi:hypothetical protein
MRNSENEGKRGRDSVERKKKKILVSSGFAFKVVERFGTAAIFPSRNDKSRLGRAAHRRTGRHSCIFRSFLDRYAYNRNTG